MANDATVAEGKALATGRDKGNCLACHVIGDGELPGNLGLQRFSAGTRTTGG